MRLSHSEMRERESCEVLATEYLTWTCEPELSSLRRPGRPPSGQRSSRWDNTHSVIRELDSVGSIHLPT